jgi:hypothetical protein
MSRVGSLVKASRFWFGACLRIHDVPDLHDEITARLGKPSECHKKRDLRPSSSKRAWPNDIWMRESPLPEWRDIGEHLAWVAELARPHVAYLRRVIRRGARMDIYMTYCCDHEHCGFGLSPEHLEIFTRIGMRFEVSIMTYDL